MMRSLVKQPLLLRISAPIAQDRTLEWLAPMERVETGELLIGGLCLDCTCPGMSWPG